MNVRILAILFPLLAAATLHARQPNLVVILADDLGYRDVGFNGCRDIPTPHIDSIAADGVRCTNAYVAFTVCAPSRAGLMTGRYGQRFGLPQRHHREMAPRRTPRPAAAQARLPGILRNPRRRQPLPARRAHHQRSRLGEERGR
jgi:arylsulfatase A-like enzyme